MMERLHVYVYTRENCSMQSNVPVRMYVCACIGVFLSVCVRVAAEMGEASGDSVFLTAACFGLAGRSEPRRCSFSYDE